MQCTNAESRSIPKSVREIEIGVIRYENKLPAVMPPRLVRVGIVGRWEGGHVGGVLGQRLLLEVGVL